MYENLDKLRAEVKRCKKKIEDDKARLKMAEDKLLRAEHSQIIADVKAVNLSPEQLAEFLKLVTAGQAGKHESLFLLHACVQRNHDAHASILRHRR